MLNFLRKFRRNQMNSKYLKYAIGEIFLVIIGILIALAVTDWNEGRIDRQREHKKLRQIQRGLETDLALLDSMYQRDMTALTKVQLLDSLLKNPRKESNEYYYPLFGTVYGIRSIEVSSAYYEDLKSFGFDRMKNDSLKLQLIHVFEDNYRELNDLRASESSINQVNRPYYLENFYDLQFFTSAIPINIDKVWNDKYYHNLVFYRKTNLEVNQMMIYKKAKSEMAKLVQKIEDYLKK